MKMPEKHDLLAAILAAKDKRRAILRLQWRTFAADIMARCVRSSAPTMCAIIA